MPALDWFAPRTPANPLTDPILIAPFGEIDLGDGTTAPPIYYAALTALEPPTLLIPAISAPAAAGA